jgi:hypothetical protein
MYYFPYKVKFYVDSEARTANGFTLAASYAEAVENITKYYGEEDIEEIQITALDTYNYILEVPNEQIKEEIIKHEC